MPTDQHQTTPLWRPWDQRLSSEHQYDDPVQDVRINVTFESPPGVRHHIDGFWDVGTTWRVRFAPDEIGAWSDSATCSDVNISGNQSAHSVDEESLGWLVMAPDNGGTIGLRLDAPGDDLQAAWIEPAPVRAAVLHGRARRRGRPLKRRHRATGRWW
jgi:hypothetical protein